MTLIEQVALVTGSGSGRASALAVARQGAGVALADRNVEAAQAVKTQIEDEAPNRDHLAVHGLWCMNRGNTKEINALRFLR